MTAFDPDYPNSASQSYRDAFVAAADKAGLRAIPATVLSRAITFALERGARAGDAGRVFADVYFDIAGRRRPRGGFGNPESYLLCAYGDELKNKTVL